MTPLACFVAGAVLGGIAVAVILIPMLLRARRQVIEADAEASRLAGYIVDLSTANTRLNTALVAARSHPLPEEIIT